MRSRNIERLRQQPQQRQRRTVTLWEALEDRRLFAVVGSPIGFGNHATGGAGGPVVTVNNAADFTTYATKTGAYTIQVQGTIDFGSVHVAPSKSTVKKAPGVSTKGPMKIANKTSTATKAAPKPPPVKKEPPRKLPPPLAASTLTKLRERLEEERERHARQAEELEASAEQLA